MLPLLAFSMGLDNNCSFYNTHEKDGAWHLLQDCQIHSHDVDHQHALHQSGLEFEGASPQTHPTTKHWFQGLAS